VAHSSKHSDGEGIGGIIVTYVVSGILGVLTVVDIVGLPNWPPFSDNIQQITLAFLIGLTIFLATDRWKEIKGRKVIRDDIKSSKVEIIDSLAGVHTRVIEKSEDGFDYLCQRYTAETTTRIEQAAIAPSTLLEEKTKNRYRKAIRKALDRKVEYTYVYVTDNDRGSRVNSFIQDKNYHPMELVNDGSIPLVSFSIVYEEDDSAEVIARYPYDPHEQGIWLVTTHPQVVNFFVAYHKKLAEAARPLAPSN